ncbi:MAG: hypothetical protein GY854_25860 [Deltaproteobacteria bacterium]|nr:hypothetical protein [Deltaproteobacteria bacterium]
MSTRGSIKDQPGYDQLDEREREVLGYFIEGKSSKEISFFIISAERTVDLYRKTIMDKLDLEDPAVLLEFTP